MSRDALIGVKAKHFLYLGSKKNIIKIDLKTQLAFMIYLNEILSLAIHLGHHVLPLTGRVGLEV